MFPPPHIPGHGPSSPVEPTVPPRPPGTNPVNRATPPSHATPPEPPSTAAGRSPISLPVKTFQPAAELWKTHVTQIADLTPVRAISDTEHDADTVSNDSLDLGRAEGKPPISLKQTEYSLKQFAKKMGQGNYSVVNRWKKVWVDGFWEN